MPYENSHGVIYLADLADLRTEPNYCLVLLADRLHLRTQNRSDLLCPVRERLFPRVGILQRSLVGSRFILTATAGQSPG
jgi:hypothetical protein